MKIRAHYLDGTTAEAPVGARAQSEVERRYSINYTDIFDSDKSRVEYAYYLCWASLRAAKQLSDEHNDDFEAWLDQVEDTEPVVDPKGSQRPTKRARRPANSSGSQS